jgi:hypothetical protein
MKVIGVLGLLLLIFGLLITVIGVGGAVANFVFPPKELVCDMADRDYQEVQKAVAEYEAAKGTSEELSKEVAAKRALDSAKSSQDACNRAKDSHRFYGMLFAGVGAVGLVMTFIGAIAAFLGLRKRKVLS